MAWLYQIDHVCHQRRGVQGGGGGTGVSPLSNLGTVHMLVRGFTTLRGPSG